MLFLVDAMLARVHAVQRNIQPSQEQLETMAYNEALALEDDFSYDESSDYSAYSDDGDDNDGSDDSDDYEPPRVPFLPDKYRDKVFQLAIIQGFDPLDIERELRGEPISIPVESFMVSPSDLSSKTIQQLRFNKPMPVFGTWTSQSLEKLDDEQLKRMYEFLGRKEPPSQLNRHDIIKQLLEWQHSFYHQPYVPRLSLPKLVE